MGSCPNARAKAARPPGLSQPAMPVAGLAFEAGHQDMAHTKAQSICPLRRPLLHGDTCKAGAHTYRVDSSMRGWVLVRDDGETVARDIDSQAELCAILIQIDGA